MGSRCSSAPGAATCLVTVGGSRYISRRRQEEGPEFCIHLVEGRGLSDTSKKRKRKAPRCTPELLEELVLEILFRLPVKSLLRFKSVSKAWRTIISDPVFIRRHLLRQKPSWLITPHALDSIIEGEDWPTTFSTQICFYRWQLDVSDTRLMYTTDFPGEFSSFSHFAHCDGLVLVPTNTKLYLFNPATRDTMTLPESSRSKMQYKHIFLPVGFGLDHRTGKYKVVRVFVRSKDPLTEVYRMGMEVFTVGEASTWRETTADLPYPVVEWITGKFVNGGLFWPIDRYHLDHDPNGIVRFSLEDETFSVIRLPDMLSLNRMLDESFLLDEMQGEICLTGFTRSTTEVVVWMLIEDHTVNSRWEHRYSLSLSDLVQPMSLLPGGAIMLQAGPNFYRYELQAPNQKLTTVCELEGLRYKGRRRRTTKQNIFFFNVIPYMESLVRIVA